MKEYGLTNYKLAKKVGISNSTVANYLSGETKPDNSKIEAISSKIGINFNWLKTGEGEMKSIGVVSGDDSKGSEMEFSILDRSEKTGTISKEEVALLRKKIQMGDAIAKTYFDSMEKLRKVYNIKD